jgi:uncharacterized Zn-finger protein
MNDLKDRIMRFMMGRYGTDQLNKALLVFYFILLIINIFARSIIIYILIWTIVFLFFFRSFSKNFHARQKENQVFLNYWGPINSKSKLILRIFREIRTHRFRRCPQCKTVLRLSRKKGKHTVKCPRCQNKFKVRVFI